MADDQSAPREEVCPDCKGRGLYRPPGEWTNETCPTCEGRGVVFRTEAGAPAKP